MSYTPEHEFHMILIAPEKGMSAVFTSVARELSCDLTVMQGGEISAVAIVSRLPADSCDVILCRRIIARHIKHHTQIPVVSVELSSMDMLRILQPYSGKIRKAALFRLDTPLYGMNYVSHALNIEIQQFIYTTKIDLQEHIDSLTKDFDVVIGGALVYEMVPPKGFFAINIVDEEEIASRSMYEAIAIARARRKEQHWNVRLDTILNIVSEGIVVLDEQCSIRLVNPAAEQLLGCTSKHILHKNMLHIFPSLFSADDFHSTTPERGRIKEIKGKILLINRIPILFQGKNTGTVCSFSDARRIQQTAENLRSCLQPHNFRTRHCFDDIQTSSPAMHELMALARLYASTNASLLLCGESGTGKEMFAQSIHCESARKNGPFVAVNCAAIPENLLESEFFGYEEGAFTGARRQGKPGFFELAHGGTLLLDEVGDIPFPLQGRLLRVLQEKEIMRVGGSHVVPVDVRVICATHQDIEARAACGDFRADLLYRLNVLTLTLPPLRQRSEDITGLAFSYLRAHLHVLPPESVLQRDVFPALLRYSWPGNVRELFSVLERLTIMGNHLAEVPHWGTLLQTVWSHAVERPCNADMGTVTTADQLMSLKKHRQRTEIEVIRECLAANRQDMGKTAKALGISRMTLWRKLTC